jgi:mannose-1-phosphate guanylyltransferase
VDLFLCAGANTEGAWAEWGRRMTGAIVGGKRLDRPKQFCRLQGESLLQRTLRRSKCITDPEHTVVVVRDGHRHWWQDELRQFPSKNILSEAANRGTGVAIFNALVHVLQHDQNATLVFLPSDHSADRETALIASVHSAARLAAANREQIVLLGIAPDSPEMGYGWILPGPGGTGSAQRVKRFVEKPEAHVALELYATGALWNSFIFASSAPALLELFEVTRPDLVRSHRERFLVRGLKEPRERALFRALPLVDFCRDILQSDVARLRVLIVPPCGWTDLGTPYRVNQWLERASAFPPGGANRGVEGQPLPDLREAITSM